MIGNWIVFERDGKLEAVEDHHIDIQEKNINANGGKIIGYVSFKHRADAITYAEQVLLP